MAKVTIQLLHQGLIPTLPSRGGVHVYRSQNGGASWQDLGRVTVSPVEVHYNIGDRFRFVAEPLPGGKFLKYCANKELTYCVTTPTFEGTIVSEQGTLYAVFAYGM